MIFLDYCDICGLKNTNPPSSFCCINHAFKQFIYCGKKECKTEILKRNFVQEVTYGKYVNFYFKGNVNNLKIPRHDGSVVDGEISKIKNIENYINKKTLEVVVNYYAELHGVYQKCEKLISYKKLQKYNTNLPIIYIKGNNNVDSRVNKKFNRDQKKIYFKCILTNHATRLLLLSYYKDGIFSNLPIDIIRIIFFELFKENDTCL